MYRERPNNGIEIRKTEQGRQFLYFLEKEGIKLWGIDRTKKTYVQEFQLVRNSKENLGWGSK